MSRRRAVVGSVGSGGASASGRRPWLARLRRTSIHDAPSSRHALVAVLATVAVAGALILVAIQRDDSASTRPVSGGSISAEAALTRLGGIVDPLETTTRETLAAVTAARAALADTSPGRAQALRDARERVLAQRLALLALEDTVSAGQRVAIGEVNRALQALLAELDAAD